MSILTQREAKLLKRSNTIDLKYMNAKEYVDNIEWNTNFMKKSKKILVFVWIAWYIVSCFYGWGIVYPKTANADHTEQNMSFLARFPDEKRVIGCYNDITLQVREESRCTTPWDHNIILPAESQIKEWLKYYNEYEIINRLALVNFESSFNESASNKYAKWYVQTLRTYSIPNDINSQLSWMKNHKEAYTRKICRKYWNQRNSYDWFDAGEYWVLSCMYRMHYHAYKWTWYAKRGILTTKFYKWYMFDQRGKTLSEYLSQ